MAKQRNASLHSLESSMIAAVKDMRAALAELDFSDMEFRVTASGRVDGDLKIEYSLGPRWGEGERAEGGRLPEVLEEFFHRNAWRKKNAPLMLAQADNSVVESTED